LISEIFEKAYKEGRTFLLEPEAKTVCIKYGIPATKFGVAKTVEEAVELAEEIGYPVVLKVVSPDIVHKFDIGGVVLNLKSEWEVQNAFNQILENVKERVPDAKVLGITVQEMAAPSTEVIIGAIKDPQFGPALMFGLGGIFTEVLRDVTFRIAPITEEEAREMITEIKAYPLLKGYRGMPPVDIEAIAQILVATSRLVMDYPEINELDLNPIIVYENGAKTVDARIILKS
jgi:acetyl-CoA synthetase (ADP-forming)